MTKRIVLCADDYGQAPPISTGILNLVKHQRLSAVSCLVNTPWCMQHGPWLLPFQNQIDIGLHFNLTEGKALSPLFIQKYGDTFFSLSTCIRQACLHQLDSAVIAAELHAQIDQFKAAMGFLPRFLDGHQHVHQFPIIRQAVIDVCRQRFAGQTFYVRWVNEPMGIDWIKNPKKIVIYLMGTRAFGRLLQQSHMAHNSAFAGIYPFSGHGYDQLFPNFLRMISTAKNGLIMCHPGLFTDAVLHTVEPLARARNDEYQYLMSDQFLSDCEKQKVVIGRFAFDNKG